MPHASRAGLLRAIDRRVLASTCGRHATRPAADRDAVCRACRPAPRVGTRAGGGSNGTEGRVAKHREKAARDDAMPSLRRSMARSGSDRVLGRYMSLRAVTGLSPCAFSL